MTLNSSDPSREFVVLLGRDVRVPFDSVLKCPRIEIGDHTRINGAINVRGAANCIIGKYCAIGYGVHILTTNHDTRYPNLQIGMQRRFGFISIEKSSEGVNIGHNVWIGDSAQILSGVNIGNGAVVGAGAVVTRNIKNFEIVYGVPARHGRYRFSKDLCRQLEALAWWDWPEERIACNKRFFNTDLETFEGDLSLIVE